MSKNNALSRNTDPFNVQEILVRINMLLMNLLRRDRNNFVQETKPGTKKSTEPVKEHTVKNIAC